MASSTASCEKFGLAGCPSGLSLCGSICSRSLMAFLRALFFLPDSAWITLLPLYLQPVPAASAVSSAGSRWRCTHAFFSISSRSSGVFSQEHLGILSSLSDLISFICCHAPLFVHNGALCRKIQDILWKYRFRNIISNSACLNGGATCFLHYFHGPHGYQPSRHPASVSQHGVHPYGQTHKLKGTSTCCLRIAEHNANLLTEFG